jgi:YVTN family beta-propeller protein
MTSTTRHTPSLSATPPLRGWVRVALPIIGLLIAGSSHAELPSGKVTKEGVTIGFRMEPISTPTAGVIQAGEDVRIHFDVKDATTGVPVAGGQPSVWLDARKAGAEDVTCKDKIAAFVQGTLAYRPEIDLNTWYILAMNKHSSITVIDPQLGFAGQRTVASVLLDGEPEEWTLSHDQKQLYVTLPGLKRVSRVNTGTWKVDGWADVGGRPGSLAIQPDGRYLWVTREMPPTSKTRGGVTVIDLDTYKTVIEIETGDGHHEVAFSDDSRVAAITNAQDGTVTLVDVAVLTAAEPLLTGTRPTGIAWSDARRAFYVIDEAQGTLTTIDPAQGRAVGQLALGTGLTDVGFEPKGRYALVTDAGADKVHVVDAATGDVVQSAKVEAAPYQVTFTDNFAYIRSAGSAHVSMIPLDQLGKGDSLPVKQFVGGQTAPDTARQLETADAMVPTPHGNAVMVNSPAEKMIYFYMEGMGSPMGSFSNRQGQPKGILVVDKTLNEGAPGTYETSLRMPTPGTYDVAFMLDAPRTWHCFSATVAAGAGAAHAKDGKVRIEYMLDRREIAEGSRLPFRFRVADAVTGKGRGDVKDLQVRTVLAPGRIQSRASVRPVGEGVYEVDLEFNKAGAWYVFVESGSLGLKQNKTPFLSLRVTPRVAAAN